MHSHGLDFIRLDAVRIKMKNLMWYMLLSPWILTATYFKTCHKERNLKRSPEGGTFCRILSSFKALCGESWVTIHRKLRADESCKKTETRLPSWHVTPEPEAKR